MDVSPPGAIATGEATSMPAPAVPTCGSSPTDHEPAPPPASEIVRAIVLLAPPELAFRSWKDSDCGSLKILGSSAAGSHASPAPSRLTVASVVAAVSAKTGRAVDMSADFTCRGVQFGCRPTRSAAAPAMCGDAKLVPSRYANCAPANSTSVDDMIWAPGAEMSGLRKCPKSVRPADEKLVGVAPFRCVSTSWMS